jgi:uncharacterized membrane protein
MIDNAALGFLPGWLVVAVVAVFYAWLVYTAFLQPAPLANDGDVHV